MKTNKSSKKEQPEVRTNFDKNKMFGAKEKVKQFDSEESEESEEAEDSEEEF